MDDRSRKEAVVDRSQLMGGAGRVVTLACGLIGAAIAFAVLGRDQAEPFVLGLLGILAMIGVFSLFASAIGLVRIVSRGDSNPLAKAFIDGFGEGVIVTDREGRIIYANRAYADLTGAEQERDLRTVESAFAGEHSADEVIYRLSQAVREGRETVEELRLAVPIASAAGSTARWYRIRVQPMTLGHRRCSLWRVADVTEDRKREEAVFLELQHAIDYLDHSPAGFLSAEPDGRIVYVNATLAEWLGIDLARFQPGALALSHIVRGDGAALLASRSDGAARAGSERTDILDLDLVKRNGQSLPVRLYHRVPVNHDGTPAATRTIVINRGPGEDASEAVRAAEVRFARFFNNTPIAIASVDARGRIGRTNAPFVRLFGAAGGEGGKPRSLADIVSPNDRRTIEAAVEQAAGGKSDIPPFDVGFGDAGEQRHARFYVSAVTEGGEEGEAAIVYALETTEQRELEAQFAQSQKMESIGQLAGGVAHDFNNVLTAIIGFSDLLLTNHRPSDPSFQDIMNIKQNANRAAGLVRQLLAFSRRQTLRPQVLALADVLSDLSILLQRLLGEKVKLQVVHGRDLWPIKADLNQLEQVIINLAVNARDAMPQGGTLSIRTRNLSAADVPASRRKGLPEADHVVIEVADTGTGIPPEVQERIFEPFFSTKEVGKGTGLGLSTVYGIVQQTGGYIFFDSEMGKGTTFFIYFPRHEAEAEAPVEAVAEKPADVTDLTGTQTILLVEDEDAVRAFAQRALEQRGYVVHTAASGVEALELMKEAGGEVDLVVSDVVMPELDGPSLLRELRKDHPDLKIIFVSGYAEEAFKKNLPDGENFGFLPKPFSLKQLATAVKEMLGR
jgi:two-component system cell cycle sensor histidine kinase/response regulator CckA